MRASEATRLPGASNVHCLQVYRWLRRLGWEHGRATPACALMAGEIDQRWPTRLEPWVHRDIGWLADMIQGELAARGAARELARLRAEGGE